MSYNSGSKTHGNPAASLKTQFNSLQASMPLTDIPSLPTPHLTSPIKQQQLQNQLHSQLQNNSVSFPSNYNRSNSSSSTSVIQSPTKSMNNQSNSSSSSLHIQKHFPHKNSGSNRSHSMPGQQYPTDNYTQILQTSYMNNINNNYNNNYLQNSQQRPYNVRTVSNESTNNVRYQQQQQQQQQQHQQKQYPHQQQHHQQQQYHHHQQQPHQQFDEQIPNYKQRNPTQNAFPAPQGYVVHAPSQPGIPLNQNYPHHQRQQPQQQQIISQNSQPSSQFSVNNSQYSQGPPISNARRYPSSQNKLPPINTQLEGFSFQHHHQQQFTSTSNDQQVYVESPLTVNEPASAKSSMNSIPPIPRALPEPNIYKNQELLPGKAFGISQRAGSEVLNKSTPQQQNQLQVKNRSPSLPFSKDSFSRSNTQQQDLIQGSQSQSIRKSPIVRQSINFLKNARNFSSSSVNQPESPITSGHSSSKEMEKYHIPLKQITSSGRVIPQKIDYSSTDNLKKSRSFSTLTRRVASNSSLRASAEKGKYISATSLSTSLMMSPSIKKKYIYPALISEVADAFLHEIKLSCHFKYGIEYRNSFSGSEAIDVICRITKIRDRNLGIILGRALDAQRLFHDVTYEHRLRDNKTEIYLISDEYSYDQSDNFKRQNSVSSTLNNIDDYSMTISASNLNYSTEKPSVGNSISGVFTLLTECYSPTCTRDKLCYSISCPRRFEQKMRAEMQTSSLTRSDSHISFTQDEQKQYWQLTVPKTVLDSLDKNEIKRQECIFETVNSEKTFVKDLEYLREFWIRPLSETKIIKDRERDQFIRNVFHNINEIWDVNHRFAEALVRRQQKSPIVDSIADIFLDFIPQFTPFITYGAGQVIGKYEFDRQRRHNPLLRRFIEDTAKREESKRLDLSSFLSKPTTRPARYPLLLKSIRDHTDLASSDYKKLSAAIELLEKMLTKINFETGKQSDKMNLFQIKQKLLFKPGELVDLKLSADNRRVIYQCVLKKKGYQEKEKQGEIHVYLFDHCLLFIKLGYLNKREVYKVYQRPIPLPLLFYSTTEYPPTIKSIRKAAVKNGSAPAQLGQNTNSALVPLNSTVAKSPMSFKYIGIHGYELTLYGTPATQKILATKIEAQTKKILADNDVYTLTPLCSNFFDSQNRINCVVPFDGGRKLLYGTDSGVYVGDRSSANSSRTKVISKVNIIQAEIIQEYQILVALCDKKLLFWPTSVLEGGDSSKNAKLAKELMNHVSFFKIGVCDGRMLLCAAKSTSNTVRIFEPIDPIQQKKQKKKFNNSREDIHFASEPVSISFLKTKLCVGCSNGFQIVSLVNNSMEELLDPADTSLEFATSKEGLKPLGIDRINSDFLLSYSNFSFFINHNGWRVRPKWIIEWEGVPHSFALWYPYLLAFDSNFIEIRSVQNSELLRVIVGENIRFLHASSQEILYAYEDDRGYDVVASLDFWDKSMKNSRSRGNTINEHNKQLSIDL